MLRIVILFAITICFGFSAHAQQAPENGLYWFKSNTDFKLASDSLDKGYYNPQRKTLIFLHGWQSNSIKNDSFESFDYKKHDNTNGFHGDLVAIWKAKGWNVGAYYWREFADDAVFWAESKIWSPNDVVGMRMKVINQYGDVETIKHNDLPYAIRSKSVSDLFYDAYIKAMARHGAVSYTHLTLPTILRVLFYGVVALLSNKKQYTQVITSTRPSSNPTPRTHADTLCHISLINQ